MALRSFQLGGWLRGETREPRILGGKVASSGTWSQVASTGATVCVPSMMAVGMEYCEVVAEEYRLLVYAWLGSSPTFAELAEFFERFPAALSVADMRRTTISATRTGYFVVLRTAIPSVRNEEAWRLMLRCGRDTRVAQASVATIGAPERRVPGLMSHMGELVEYHSQYVSEPLRRHCGHAGGGTVYRGWSIPQLEYLTAVRSTFLGGCDPGTSAIGYCYLELFSASIRSVVATRLGAFPEYAKFLAVYLDAAALGLSNAPCANLEVSAQLVHVVVDGGFPPLTIDNILEPSFANMSIGGKLSDGTCIRRAKAALRQLQDEGVCTQQVYVIPGHTKYFASQSRVVHLPVKNRCHIPDDSVLYLFSGATFRIRGIEFRVDEDLLVFVPGDVVVECGDTPGIVVVLPRSDYGYVSQDGVMPLSNSRETHFLSQADVWCVGGVPLGVHRVTVLDSEMEMRIATIEADITKDRVIWQEPCIDGEPHVVMMKTGPDKRTAAAEFEAAVAATRGATIPMHCIPSDAVLFRDLCSDDVDCVDVAWHFGQVWLSAGAQIGYFCRSRGGIYIPEACVCATGRHDQTCIGVLRFKVVGIGDSDTYDRQALQLGMGYRHLY